MNETELLKIQHEIVQVNILLDKFWSNSHGWAPSADLISKSRLDNQVSLSYTLRRLLSCLPRFCMLSFIQPNLDRLLNVRALCAIKHAMVSIPYNLGFSTSLLGSVDVLSKKLIYIFQLDNLKHDFFKRNSGKDYR